MIYLNNMSRMITDLPIKIIVRAEVNFFIGYGLDDGREIFRYNDVTNQNIITHLPNIHVLFQSLSCYYYPILFV